ncbi:MAG: hypothetical protein LBQ92_01450 [Propionibacteriaceae bacterium]|jgi:predicted nucleic acid-binding protein|nr:hypothetical protein [Propionibacteriaceae bacterium]
MRVLFDTNLLIRYPSVEWLAEREAASFHASAISLAELAEGEFSGIPQVSARAPIEVANAKTLFGAGLPFDDKAADMYPVVCRAVIAGGRTLARPRRIDMMIAAVALANGCALATQNPKDFVGLEPILEIIPA